MSATRSARTRHEGDVISTSTPSGPVARTGVRRRIDWTVRATPAPAPVAGVKLTGSPSTLAAIPVSPSNSPITR